MTLPLDDKALTERRSPNPGSAAALALGCTCAVIDNHHGRGAPTRDGPVFWMTEGCPVHSPKHGSEADNG